MSIGSFFKSLTHQKVNVPKVLTAAETFVSDALPVVGDDLAALIKTLPDARTSIFTVAEEAVKLWHDAKGQKISFSLGLHAAQARSG